MPDNVLINFTADPAGLQPGIDGMEQLITIDKELHDAIVKTTAAEVTRNKTVSDGAKAAKKDVEGLVVAVENVSKVAVGGTIVSSLKAISAEMTKITAIKASNVPFVDNLAARLKLLQPFIDQTSKKIKDLPPVLEKIKPSAANATTALSNFGRVVQDAPFGILGIANNIDPLVDSFQRLSAQTGGTKGALQSMLAGLSGPAGIGIAISAVTSLAIAFGGELADMFSDYFPSAERALEKQKNFNDSLKEANDILVELAKSYSTLYTNRTAEADKALSVAEAENKSQGEIYQLKQKAIAAKKLENFYVLGSLGLTEQDVKLNEAQLELLNEQLHAIQALVTNKKGLTDQDKLRADNLKSQIAALKSTTDAGRDALNSIKDAQKESEVAAAAEARTLYELSVKSAVASVEARVAAAKKGSIEERDAQIAAIKARVQAEKDLNVDLTSGERLKLEIEAQKAIQQIHFDYQKKALQDAKLGVEAQVLQAKAGTEQEFNLKLQALEASRLVELKDQELTSNKKQEINARYYKQAIELAKAFNQKVAENELNTQLAGTQDKIAQLEFSNVEKSNGELIKLKQDLIDQQAAIEVVGVSYSEKNEELRNAKIKLIYDKALTAKQDLERAKREAEINREDKPGIDAAQNEIDIINSVIQASGAGELVKRAGRRKTFEVSKELAFQEEGLDRQLLSNKSITQEEFNKRQIKRQQDLAAAEFQIKVDNIKQIQEIEDIAADHIQQIGDLAFQNKQVSLQKELDQDQQLYDSKLITENEFNARKEEIDRKQARLQQEKAIFDIAIGLAKGLFDIQAQAAILSSNPLTAGLAVNSYLQEGLLIGEAAFQTGLVLAKKYKTGGMIEGPGSGTSDSIPAWLSAGEYVTKADMTSKHQPILEAINKDRLQEYLINVEMPKMWKNYDMPMIPLGMEGKVINMRQPEMDMDKLGEVIAKKLGEHQQLTMSMDEDGFTLSIKQGLKTIEYKNKKLLA